MEVCGNFCFLVKHKAHGFSAAGGQEATKERAAHVCNSHLGWGKRDGLVHLVRLPRLTQGT